MKTSRSTARVPAALLFAVLVCAAATASAAPKSVALANFSVHTPSELDHDWLGPAMAELLQAKMQLFGGARVLERRRVRSILRNTGMDGSQGDGDTAELLAFIPAQVLVAGSVTVAPGEDSTRIRVHARAFETATAEIVSEASFSSRTDLAGLLSAAEEIARTLAKGLGLSYAPEQLAYAEPERVDSLRLFVEGNRLFDTGQFRKAVEVYQRALDGNAGRFFPAAHRAQGETYRALADSLTRADADPVREEYLNKFREDAVLASGALYDLGLAYEANGMLPEAIEIYDDYISVVGKETVRWRANLRDALPWQLKEEEIRKKGGGLSLEINPLHVDEKRGKIDLLATLRTMYPRRMRHLNQKEMRFVTLDADDGALLEENRWSDTIFDLPPAGGRTKSVERLLGFDGGTAVFEIRRYSDEKRAPEECSDFFIVSIDGKSRRLWKTTVPVPPGNDCQRLDQAVMYGGKIFIVYDYYPVGEAYQNSFLLTLDGTTGKILSTIAPIPKGQSGGLDIGTATLSTPDGVIDLTTGEITPFSALYPGEAPFGRDNYPLPTGIPGITYRRVKGSTILYRDRERVFTFGDAMLVRDHAMGRPITLPSGGPLVFSPAGADETGFAIIYPETWEKVSPFRDYKGDFPVRLLRRHPDYLAFEVTSPALESNLDNEIRLPGALSRRLVNLFDIAGKRIIPREMNLSDFGRDFRGLAERDMIVMRDEALSRINLFPERSVIIMPAAEAKARKIEVLIQLGDTIAASRELEVAWGEMPELRAYLLRMKIFAHDGNWLGAKKWALWALNNGTLPEEDVRACLDAIRLVHPEVRDIIITLVRKGITLQSMAAPDLLVGSSGNLHLLLDVSGGNSDVRVTRIFTLPDMYDCKRRQYSGRHFVCDRWKNEKGEPCRDCFDLVDLFTGEESFNRSFPFPEGAVGARLDYELRTGSRQKSARRDYPVPGRDGAPAGTYSLVRVNRKHGRSSFLMVWNGLVYETLGNGVILVKDLAGGKGLELVHN